MRRPAVRFWRGVGVLLGLGYIFGLPVLFVVVELLAMRALRHEPALVFWLGFIIMWNVIVLGRRAWQLARTGRVTAA